ncbi:MAG: hypothetical protein DRH93_03330 [Deltaproteobacteria bacterium]|nr:MAG: hypothetical protein DRH93_03330 [Deltaproteobacteria bacterium]
MKDHDDVKVKQTGDEAILSLMRKRFAASIENEKSERKQGQDDIEFINGKQWEKDVIEQRGKGRLCLTINKLPTFLDQIDGDIRLNTPALKVKAVDDHSDPDTADVLEGIIRYIQRNSRANKIHSWAGLHAAAGGRGAWRVLTGFVSDASMEQEIILKRISDAYSVYYDPAAEDDDKQDGGYFILAVSMTKEEYKEEYGKDPVDFDLEGDEFDHWHSDNRVTIVEYFYKVKGKTHTLYQDNEYNVFTDKEAVDMGYSEEELKAFESREVTSDKIEWIKADGKKILDRERVPGSMFPVVLTWGKQLSVKGKIETRGIARHAKDSVRLYNYSRSNEAESISLQPKQPYLMPDVCMTSKQQKIWDKANDENYPYLPYHVDPEHPSLRPIRERPPSASSGNLQQLQIADSEMRDTIGIQKAALGQEGNETSGVAIQKRKQESDTGQYAFLDNLGDAIVTEGKIILSMIPEIITFPTQRKILGKDMKEKVIAVNQEGGIDLTTGKYDIDMSPEGSYSTQREEFQEKLESLLPQIPDEQRAVISDIMFEMQDFHRADDVAARLKRAIQAQYPGIIEETEDDLDENSGGGAIDPETGQPIDNGGQPTQEQQVDPVQQQAIAQQQQAMDAEAEKAKLDADIQKVKLEQEQAKLEGMKYENMQKKQLVKEDTLALLEQVLDEIPIENKQRVLNALNQLRAEG